MQEEEGGAHSGRAGMCCLVASVASTSCGSCAAVVACPSSNLMGVCFKGYVQGNKVFKGVYFVQQCMDVSCLKGTSSSLENFWIMNRNTKTLYCWVDDHCYYMLLLYPGCGMQNNSSSLILPCRSTALTFG